MDIVINHQYFQIDIKVKKVKRTTLRVIGKDSLRITTPTKLSRLMVETMVISHYDWIIKQMNERVFLLPNQLLLQGFVYHIQLDDHLVDPYHIQGEVIYYRLGGIETLLSEVQCEIAKKFNEAAIPYGDVSLRFRKMKTRWGVCHIGKRHIVLNTKLIMLPDELMMYVIYHELTHLLVPNHQKEFYVALEKKVSNPYVLRKKIKEYVIFL
ncbi:MAG: SprT-like domain-containing protein [Bacilli bacterium]